MKKLFLFAAALISSLSMMAQNITVTVPTSTFTLPDLDSEWTWAGKIDNHYVVKGDTVIFNTNELYQSKSTKQPWYAAVGGGTGSTDWAAQGSFVGAAGWTLNGAKVNTYATVKSETDRLHFYRVTNCNGALALVKSGSNKKRTIYLEAYLLTEGVAATTPAASATWEETTEHIIAIEGLDVTKEYVIALYAIGTGSAGSSSGNSNVYEVAFVSGVAPTKYTVTYMDGEKVLGTESVKEGEDAVKAGNFQDKAHATFDGWFEDTDYTMPANFNGISADMTVYGKWTAEPFTASTSINIEQLVIDNGKSYAIADALTAAHITYANIDALDSLDASKTANNEPYLGLKLKKKDAYLEVAVPGDAVLRVKLGAVAAAFKVNIDGVDSTLQTSAANTVFELTATKDMYVRFTILTDSKTVVFKQIMINQEIAEVQMPAVLTDATLATLTLDGEAIEGFSAAKKEYTITLAAGTTLPVVAATATDANATVGTITQASSLPGDATFTVTAADGTTTVTYTIHFVLPRAIEYLSAPYNEVNADYSTLPNWLHGNVVYNGNYTGGDTTYCGYQVLRTQTNTDPIDFYVGACDSLVLRVSATGGRTAQLAIGDSIYATTKVAKGAIYELAAYIHSESEQNHVVFTTPGATGGTTISGIRLTEYANVPTAMENTEAVKAQKVMINGKLNIIRDGIRYDALGNVME